ncbi:hypothetical protein F3I02_25390 [Bacillus sp. SRB3LM]|nr:hypothetical protein [Bacillus sp. SRB3LM]MBG0970750.1 hypothetical protein [Bacillus sp. SRB3LM]MBG0971984.1 hypothetical protein [Bacillus sp. SRB3LM]
MRSGCFSANQTCRRINRYVWEEYKEIALVNKRTSAGTRLYKLRSSTIERSFADATELHGYRYAHFRGRESVQMQAYLYSSLLK